MKNVVYLLIALSMISCGSNGKQSKHGKTIGDYLQTDKRGSKHDLKFKIIELNEQGTITVADSIAHLTDEFRKDKELIVKRVELAKKMTETLLTNEKKQSKIDKYNTDIAVMDARIDSLRSLPPDNLNGHDSKKPNDVLALIIRCKYSVVPLGGTTVEETFDFYLSPDGSKCYGKTRAK